MPRHRITVEDLWAMPRVGAPVPAGDGEFVIVPVTTYSPDSNEGMTRLWLVPTTGAPPRPLTTAEASTGQPAVSPDGARLAFVRKPGGAKEDRSKGSGTPGKNPRGPKHPDQPQLHVLPLAGGEAERLTDLPLGVADPRWFPDGRRIAFLAPVFAAAPSLEATAETAASLEAAPRPFVTEDRVYRFWDRWLTDRRVHHIFVLDLETRALVDLTPGSDRWIHLMDPADQYRIAPDGKEIAFSACRSEPPYDPVLWGVYTVPVPAALDASIEPQAPALLTRDHTADAERPVYSPDGAFIVYGMQREIDFYGDRMRLAAFERASGKHTVLTEAWDRSAAGWTFGHDGREIVFVAETEGRTALFSLDLGRALGDPNHALPREIVRGGTFSNPLPAGGRIFTTLQSLSQPPEVVSVSLDGAEIHTLTDFTGPQLDELDLGAVEEIVFPGAGGDPVQMFLVHPPGILPRASEKAGAGAHPRAGDRDGPRSVLADAGAQPPGGERGAAPSPLVQVIHGGPHAASGDQWHWRWNAQLFAAPGYLVAMVNFHGSTGWGQSFAASILGRWGDQPFADVMAATDLLVARGLADPARMAATGGSYGGYLAAWIAGKTDRFACIVNHAGVCDFQTQLASDVTQGRRRAMGGDLWENIEGIDRYNPIRHARGFRSPMLVLHGERDYRVPYTQGIEIYNVYKARRLPARLVCYSDENHWILKRSNSLHWYGEVHAWLARWLRDEDGNKV